MNYADFQLLTFEHRPNGVLLITLNRPEVMNATNARLHWELTKIWAVVNDDEQTKVAVVTGAGDKAFSAGGDLEWVAGMVGKPAAVNNVLKEAADVVYNMLACDKVIISAINGVAVGAGLAVAMLADISIMAEEARITDGHVKLGVAAGDHAAIVWPLLCGMAKAKYYLLTADFLDGKECERIGLVSLCCPRAELMERALQGRRQARGRQPDRDPLHEEVAEQLDARRAADLRQLARARDAVLHGRRRAAGRRRGAREEARPTSRRRSVDG